MGFTAILPAPGVFLPAIVLLDHTTTLLRGTTPFFPTPRAGTARGVFVLAPKIPCMFLCSLHYVCDAGVTNYVHAAPGLKTIVIETIHTVGQTRSL